MTTYFVKLTDGEDHLIEAESVRESTSWIEFFAAGTRVMRFGKGHVVQYGLDSVRVKKQPPAVA